MSELAVGYFAKLQLLLTSYLYGAKLQDLLDERKKEVVDLFLSNALSFAAVTTVRVLGGKALKDDGEAGSSIADCVALIQALCDGKVPTRMALLRLTREFKKLDIPELPREANEPPSTSDTSKLTEVSTTNEMASSGTAEQLKARRSLLDTVMGVSSESSSGGAGSEVQEKPFLEYSSTSSIAERNRETFVETGDVYRVLLAVLQCVELGARLDLAAQVTKVVAPSALHKDINGCGVLDILSSCVEVFQSGKGYEGNVGSHTFAIFKSLLMAVSRFDQVHRAVTFALALQIVRKAQMSLDGVLSTPPDSENETVRKFVMNPLHSYAVRVILAVVGEGGSSGSDEGNLSAIRNSLQGVRIGEFELSKLLSSSEQRQALADEQCLDNLLSLLVLAYREQVMWGVEGVESEKKVESDATEADEPSAEEKQTTEGEDAGEDDGLGKSLGELMIGSLWDGMGIEDSSLGASKTLRASASGATAAPETGLGSASELFDIVCEMFTQCANHFRFQTRNLDALFIVVELQSPGNHDIGPGGASRAGPLITDRELCGKIRACLVSCTKALPVVCQDEVLSKFLASPFCTNRDFVTMVAWVVAKRWEQDAGLGEGVILRLWDRFFGELRRVLSSADVDNVINVEHVQLLMFGFELLDFPSREQLLKTALELLGQTLQGQRSNLLALARLNLVVAYMTRYLDAFCSESAAMFRETLFSPSMGSSWVTMPSDRIRCLIDLVRDEESGDCPFTLYGLTPVHCGTDASEAGLKAIKEHFGNDDRWLSSLLSISGNSGGGTTSSCSLDGDRVKRAAALTLIAEYYHWSAVQLMQCISTNPVVSATSELSLQSNAEILDLRALCCELFSSDDDSPSDDSAVASGLAEAEVSRRIGMVLSGLERAVNRAPEPVYGTTKQYALLDAVVFAAQLVLQAGAASTTEAGSDTGSDKMDVEDSGGSGGGSTPAEESTPLPPLSLPRGRGRGRGAPPARGRGRGRSSKGQSKKGLSLSELLSMKKRERDAEKEPIVQEKAAPRFPTVTMKASRDALSQYAPQVLETAIGGLRSMCSLYRSVRRRQLVHTFGIVHAEVFDLMLQAGFPLSAIEEILEKLSIEKKPFSGWRGAARECSGDVGTRFDRALEQHLAIVCEDALLLESTLRSAHTLVSSLLQLCLDTVSFLSGGANAEGEAIVKQRSDSILEVVTELSLDDGFDSCTAVCDMLMEKLADGKNHMVSLLGKHKLVKVERLLEHLLQPPVSTQTALIGALERSVAKAINFMSELSSSSSRRGDIVSFFSPPSASAESGASSELGAVDDAMERSPLHGDVSVVYRLLGSGLFPLVHVAGLKLLAKLCYDASGARDVSTSEGSAIKQSLTASVSADSDDNIRSWLRARLLGCNRAASVDAADKQGDSDAMDVEVESDGAAAKHRLVASAEERKYAVKLLKLWFLDIDPEFSLRVFDILLSMLEESFRDWPTCAASYFTYVASHASMLEQLPRLARAVSALFSDAEFLRSPPNETDADGKCVLLEFLRRLLLECSRTFQNSVSMDVVNLHASTGSIGDNGLEELEREKGLAKQLCTYAETENTFVMQHWYYCYTCNLVQSVGACSICAQVCHAGHDVVYGRKSKFYCDCGAGGAAQCPPCKALREREVAEPGGIRDSQSGDLQLSTSDFSSMGLADGFITEEDAAQILRDLRGVNLPRALLNLYTTLLTRLQDQPVVPGEQDAASSEKDGVDLLANPTKQVSWKSDYMQTMRMMKRGAFEVRLNFETELGRDTRALLGNHAVTRNALAANADGNVAVAERDKVTLFDGTPMLEDSRTGKFDRNNLQVLSTTQLQFEILHMSFNSCNSHFLAVGGLKDCLVITFSDQGSCQSRLPVTLSLDAMGENLFIVKLMWIPGSETKLAVVTNRFIKVYDLAQDSISPINFFSLLEDTVRDVTIARDSEGLLNFFIMGQSGVLYVQQMFEASDGGECFVCSSIAVPEQIRGTQGVAVHYSEDLNSLVCCYEGGRCFAARLNSSLSGFEQSVWLTPPPRGSKGTLNALWSSVAEQRGLLLCLTRKAMSVVALAVGEDEVVATMMRSTGSRIEGYVAVPRSSAAARAAILVLSDDGSLVRFAPPVAKESKSTSGASSDVASSSSPSSSATDTATAAKKLKMSQELLSLLAHSGATAKAKRKALLQAKASSSSSSASSGPVSADGPTFPITFFEEKTCITPFVTFGGDILASHSADVTKERLRANDQCIVSPSQDGFTLSIDSGSANMLIVGVRVLVGQTAEDRIPKTIQVHSRTIRLRDNVRRWYDIPLTDGEVIQGARTLSLVVSPPSNADNPSVIDSVEVYGMSKKAFKWERKLAKWKRECKSSSENDRELGRCVSRSGEALAAYFDAERHDVSASSSESTARHTTSDDVIEAVAPLLVEESLSHMRSSIKTLLRALSPTPEAYYALKDSTRLRHLGTAYCTAEGDVASPSHGRNVKQSLDGGFSSLSGSPEQAVSDIRTIGLIAMKRPQNIRRWIAEEPGFTKHIVQLFWSVYDKSGGSGSIDLESCIGYLVELLFVQLRFTAECATPASSVAILRPSFDLVRKFLLHDAEVVRGLSSTALSNLIGRLSQDDMLCPSRESESSVAFLCDVCSEVISGQRWHCLVCEDFDLCDACKQKSDKEPVGAHLPSHACESVPIDIAVATGREGSLPGTPGVGDPDAELDDEDDESLLSMAMAMSLNDSMPMLSQCSLREAIVHLLLPEVKSVCAPPNDGDCTIALLQVLLAALQSPPTDEQRSHALAEALATSMVAQLQGLSDAGTERSARMEHSVLAMKVLSWVAVGKRQEATGAESAADDDADFLLPDGGAAEVCEKKRGANDAMETEEEADAEKPQQSGKDERAKVEAKPFANVVRELLLEKGLANTLLDVVRVWYEERKNQAVGTCAPDDEDGVTLLKPSTKNVFVSKAPFFRDSVVRNLRDGDVFAEFDRVFLRTTFQLVSRLAACDKPLERGFSREWLELCCRYLDNESMMFVHGKVTRAMMKLCETKEEFHRVRDGFLFERLAGKVVGVCEATEQFARSTTYDESVELITALHVMQESAEARPSGWQQFVCKDTSSGVLRILFSNVFVFPPEAVSSSLQLIGRALLPSITAEKDGGSQGIALESALIATDPDEHALKRCTKAAEEHFARLGNQLDMFFADESKISAFVEEFVLQHGASSVRVEAERIVRTLWVAASEERKAVLFECLFAKFVAVPACGSRASEFMQLFEFVVGQYSVLGTADGDLLNRYLQPVLQSMLAQNSMIAAHPNSQLYKTLSSVLDLGGYYLESDPCLVCNDPEVPFQAMKFDALRTKDTKWTETAQIVRLNDSHVIKSCQVYLHDVRKSKMVRTIVFWYNNKEVNEISELKNNLSLWKKAKEVQLARGETEVEIVFPIPITAINIMIEYADLYEDAQALAQERLTCPRCNRPVFDRHGICRYDHENAYQCRQCRNINFDNLTGFLCISCGYSKYGNFQYVLMAKPSYAPEAMQSDEDRNKGLEIVEKESANALKCYEGLQELKKPLVNLCEAIVGGAADDGGSPSRSSDSDGGIISGPIRTLAQLYGRDCKSLFESLRKSTQILLGTRRELVRYNSRSSAGESSSHSHSSGAGKTENKCFGCASSFVLLCTSVLRRLASIQNTRKWLVEHGLIEQLVAGSLHQGTAEARKDTRALLCALVKDDAQATQRLNQLIQDRVAFAIRHYKTLNLPSFIGGEIELLCEAWVLDDSCWEHRFRAAMGMLFSAIGEHLQNPVIVDNVILPLFKQLVSICKLHSGFTPDFPFSRDGYEGDKQADTPATSDSGSSNGAEDAPGEARAEPSDPMVVECIDDEVADSSAGPSTPTTREVDEEPRTPDAKPHGAEMNLETISLSDAMTLSDTPDCSVLRVNVNVSKVAGASFEKWHACDASCTYEQWSQASDGAVVVDTQRAEAELSADTLKQRTKEWMESANDASPHRTSDSPSAAADVPTFSSTSWLGSLLLNRMSAALRKTAAAFVECVASGSLARRQGMVLFLAELMASASKHGDAAVELFDVFKSLTAPIEMRAFLVSRGFLLKLTTMIDKEIARIRDLEHSFSSDISQGLVLRTLVSILVEFLESPSIQRRFKASNMMGLVLQGFLKLRGLVVQKSKVTDSSCDSLLGIVKSLHAQNDEDYKLFMVACIEALSVPTGPRTPIFIFEQLCNIVCPKKEEVSYLMVLNKSATQEDFIRGKMSHNPYSSAEVGPLMRDVKNKICRELEMVAFIEDDNMMELLVCNKIISLDLPVKLVYEQVWRKDDSGGGEGSAMLVVFRVQGLDGDAHEEMVDSLVDDSDKEKVDPEVEFKITEVMSECGGLDAMLAQIGAIHDFDEERELAELVLNLLYHCCKLRVNRLKMIQLNSLSVLLNKLKLAFPRESQAAIAERLLLIIESVVEEANKMDDDAMAVEGQMEADPIADEGEGVAQMTMFLEKLSSPLLRCNPDVRKGVTRVLPFLTYGRKAICEVLVSYFEPYLRFDEHDESPMSDAVRQHHMECFVNVTNSIKADSHGAALKDVIVEHGISDLLFAYLDTHFRDVLGTGHDEQAWTDALARPSLPFVLQCLTGIASNHVPTQNIVLTRTAIPKVLLEMSEIPTKNHVGNSAENLVKSLTTNNSEVEEAFRGLREKVEAEKKELARLHREAMLAAAGLTFKDRKIEPKVVMDLGGVDDDDGFDCQVCREGYAYMPETILGFYVYSKRTSLLRSGASSGRDEIGYSTVTNFNHTHFTCHNDAARADANLRPRKEEWEGAAVRNSSTLCNNIFPMRGPNISDVEYDKRVDHYWSTLSNQCGRCESTRVRLLIHDMKFLLYRYCTDQSFSADSGGGGRESNIKFIPFFVQMGLHLLDQKGGAQRRVMDQKLSEFLTMEPGKAVEVCSQADDCVFMATSVPFLMSSGDWAKWKKLLLDRLLIQAAHDAMQSGTSRAELLDIAQSFEAFRPMLLFALLVDRIQGILYPAASSGDSDTSQTAACSHDPSEPWIAAVKDRLMRQDVQVVEEHKKLCAEFENEYSTFCDVMEFFEVIGVLADVLKSAPSCDAYVAALIENAFPSS